MVARFDSRFLPLFRRRTGEVDEFLPEFYLQGLAQGNFELACVDCWVTRPAFSRSSLQRLRAKWKADSEA